MSVQQVETATVVGTITQTGNATVTITSRDLTGSPLAISVAVTDTDTASIVGGLIRTALAFNQYVAAQFLVSGAGANVVLTKHVAAANDSTLNIAIANGTCTGLTAAPTSTNTTAGDGLSNAYCAILELRNTDVIKFQSATDTSHDDLLTDVINAVSRKIDDYTGRRFYAASETRYYTARDPYCLKVHDISSTSGVTIETDLNGDGVFEYTWSSTDYNLAPYNALSYGWAFTEIERTPQGIYTFPLIRRGTKVTASFGWASVPSQVNIACILQSNRIWSRFKTPLGMAGASAVGTITMNISKLDPDVCEMLDQYRSMI
jgi:hypothetical protein